jgi:hypothetical protein
MKIKKYQQIYLFQGYSNNSQKSCDNERNAYKNDKNLTKRSSKKY